MSTGIYVLGGAQTDFARNWAREDKDLFAMFEAAAQAALADARVDAAEIEVGHVGNFVAELFCRQGLLGGFFGLVDPAMADMPASRHEAACASGSIAILSAMTDIESGRYDCALVLGIEQMRNVPGSEAAEHLGAAIWTNHECQGVRWPWPHLFARLGDEYERRYGLKHEHLMAISRNNFDNARRNPYAQSRNWTFTEASFTADDEANPVGATGVRMVLDCARQVTDRAGDCQVEGARDFATLNVGGSACTVVSFVVGR